MILRLGLILAMMNSVRSFADPALTLNPRPDPFTFDAADARENQAYLETLRLCASYPFASAKAPGGPEPGWAWLAVLSHGLLRPLAWLRKQGTRSGQARKDFDSTADLTATAGFRVAAAECLGTRNPRAITSFAFALATVDILGSLLTSEAIFLPINASLEWIAGRTEHVWSKNVPGWAARRGLRFAVWSVLPLGALNVFAYYRRLVAVRAETERNLNAGERAPRPIARRAELIHQMRGMLDSAHALNELSQFETWASEILSPADRAAARRDLNRLLGAKNLSRRDQTYLDDLTVVMSYLR